MYIKTPCGAVIKYTQEVPRVWDSYSYTNYYGRVMEPEKVPAKATHTVALIACNSFGVAGIVGQHSGTMGQCEEWVTEQAKRYGKDMPSVKFIPLGD